MSRRSNRHFPTTPSIEHIGNTPDPVNVDPTRQSPVINYPTNEDGDEIPFFLSVPMYTQEDPFNDPILGSNHFDLALSCTDPNSEDNEIHYLLVREDGTPMAAVWPSEYVMPPIPSGQHSGNEFYEGIFPDASVGLIIDNRIDCNTDWMEDPESSCEGYCGGSNGASCYCDDMCHIYQDCCIDSCDYCGHNCNEECNYSAAQIHMLQPANWGPSTGVFYWRCFDGFSYSEIASYTIFLDWDNATPINPHSTQYITPGLDQGGRTLENTVGIGWWMGCQDSDVPEYQSEEDFIFTIVDDSNLNGQIDFLGFDEPNYDGNFVKQEFNYTPSPDFFGDASFTFKCNDGVIDSAVGTYHIIVEEGPTTCQDLTCTCDNEFCVEGEPWVDNMGFGCDNYEEFNACEVDGGNFPWFGNCDINAQAACCFCGGGTEGGPGETNTPPIAETLTYHINENEVLTHDFIGIPDDYTYSEWIPFLICFDMDNPDVVVGCTEPEACNYNSEATNELPFQEMCWYPSDGCTCEDPQNSIVDECGVCGGDGTPCPEIEDCLGNPGGTAIHDECGYCEGDSFFNFFLSYTCNFIADSDLAWIYPCPEDVYCCPYIGTEYPEFYPTYPDYNDYAANGFHPPCGAPPLGVDGICEECDGGEGISGCTDELACNYNAAATEDDDSCEEDDCAGECGGTAIHDECGFCENSGFMGITTTTCDSDILNADKYWTFECSSIESLDCCAYVPGHPFYGYPEFYPTYTDINDYATNGFLPPCGIHTDDTDVPGICIECGEDIPDCDMCGWCEGDQFYNLTIQNCVDMFKGDSNYPGPCSSIGSLDCCSYVAFQETGYAPGYPTYPDYNDYADNGFHPPCGFYTKGITELGVCEECDRNVNTRNMVYEIECDDLDCTQQYDLGSYAYLDEASGLTADGWGYFVYVPPLGFVGTDTFRYRCHDGIEWGAYSEITIEVGNINSQPQTMGNQQVETTEDIPVELHMLCMDSDILYNTQTLDDITFIIVNQTALNGTLTEGDKTDEGGGLVKQTYTFTPTPGYSGLNTFTWKCNDTILDSDTSTFTVIMNPAVETALNPIGNQEFEENGELVIELSSEVDGTTYECESHTPANYTGYMACQGTIPCSEWSFLYSFYESGDDDYCTINGTIDDCMWSGESCVADQGTGHDCSVWSCPTEDNEFGNEFCSETLVTDSPILCDIDGSTLTLSALPNWSGSGTVTVTAIPPSISSLRDPVNHEHNLRVNYEVDVSDFIYDPQDLVINRGDTVTWSNIDGGTHNVDGRLSTYPGNPVGFYSGAWSQDLWDFSFTFESNGLYNYKSSVHGGTGMVGTVSVAEAGENWETFIVTVIDDGIVGIGPPGDISLLSRDIFGDPDNRVTVVDGTDADGAPDSSFDPLVDPRTITGLIEDGGAYYLLIIKPGGLNTGQSYNQWGWDDIDLEDDWIDLAMNITIEDDTLLTATFTQYQPWEESFSTDFCTDKTLTNGESWHDAYTDGTHDCDWYRIIDTVTGMDRCIEWGDGTSFQQMTANDACCGGEVMGVADAPGYATCSGGIATQFGFPHITLKPLPNQHGTTDITIELQDTASNITTYTYSVTIDTLIDRPFYHNALDSNDEFQSFGQIQQTEPGLFSSISDVSVTPMGCKGYDPITKFKFKYTGAGEFRFNDTLYEVNQALDDGFMEVDVTNTGDELTTGTHPYSIGFEIQYISNQFFAGSDEFYWTCTSGDYENVAGYLYNWVDELIDNDWAYIPELYDYAKTGIEVEYSEFDMAFGYDVDLDITIEQSLLYSHDPFGGMSIITDGLQNTKQSIDDSDDDKRPSLGMFYYDDNNLLRDEFTPNLPSPFIQITKSNLIENGNGRMVKYRADNFPYQNWCGETGQDSAGNPDCDPNEYGSGYPTDYYIPRGGWGYLNMTGVEDLDNVWYERYFPQCTPPNEPYGCDDDAPMYAGWKSYTPPGEDETGLDVDYDTARWARWIHNSNCYSYESCLLFENDPSAAGVDTDRYIEINQYQEIDTTDILPFSSLTVSFWMKTALPFTMAPAPVVEAGVKLGGDPGRPGSCIDLTCTCADVNCVVDGPWSDVDGENCAYYVDNGVCDTEGTDGGLDPVTGEVYPYFGNCGISAQTACCGCGGGGDIPEDDVWSYNNEGYIDQQGSYNSILDYSTTNPKNIFGGAGRFTNTTLNKWEKMEYSFNLIAHHLQAGTDKLKKLWFLIQWGFEGDGKVYLDNFSVTNGYQFIPDADVRMKKGENEYGTGILTEYYDPNIPDQLQKYNDTTAPLESSFYFYPRYNSNDIFDFDRSITYNDFRNGMYYIYDVDWGDGSSNEFTSEPEKLGDNKMIYHTYETSGIYEVTGTMLRMKPDRDYNPLGVAFNQRFTLRININEGLDEDFKYFGSDGFSFIPYKNTLPIIGGYNKESIYYKSIKRQLGFISDDINVNIEFEKISDKLKTEVALVKMDSNFETTIIPEFQIPRYDTRTIDTSVTPHVITYDGEEVYTGTLYGRMEEELGDSIGDADITNIRYFNEPKQMYKMLGFDTDNGGIPDDPRHWKNIIPEGTLHMDRNGITIDDNGIYDIDTTVEQTWNSGNYYPVLPNYNKFGLFNYDYELESYDYVNNNIPFPSGSITDEELNDSSLKINITSNQIESNILDDLSGNQNHGFAFSDYRPNFDNQTLEPKKVKNTDRIRSSKNDGGF